MVHRYNPTPYAVDRTGGRGHAPADSAGMCFLIHRSTPIVTPLPCHLVDEMESSNPKASPHPKNVISSPLPRCRLRTSPSVHPLAHRMRIARVLAQGATTLPTHTDPRGHCTRPSALSDGKHRPRFISRGTRPHSRIESQSKNNSCFGSISDARRAGPHPANVTINPVPTKQATTSQS